MSMALMLSLMACGTPNDASKPGKTTAELSAQESESSTPTEENATIVPEETESDMQPQVGKVLVVYYSASGNTQRVAEDIAETLGGDLFELGPTEIYSNSDLNWTDRNSRVSREHDDESLCNVPLAIELPNKHPKTNWRMVWTQLRML